MERAVGMDVLSCDGWLRSTPVEFRNALLARCRWECLEVGTQIQLGGEENGELIGLAGGIIELRTVLGSADTPIMHFVHPVVWFGYGPIAFGRPRVAAANTRSPVWVARASHGSVRGLLDKRPEWWRHFLQPAATNGDIALSIAADLLIRDSERRCAAVLLRLSGHRFIGPNDREPVDVPITQDELADATNLSRSSVRSILHRLVARKLIEQGYRGIVVRAPAALRAFIDQG